MTPHLESRSASHGRHWTAGSIARVTARLRCVAIAVALIGCSRATEPLTYFSPQLADIAVDPLFSVLRNSGLVVISAVPVDSLTRPAPNLRLRVSVRSAAGDSEELDLGPTLCGDIGGAYYCSDLAVTMKSGHAATELKQTIEAVGARFWSVSVSGSFAGVWVFDRRRLDAVRRTLASIPSVSAVERDFVRWSGDPSSAAFAEMIGALPLDYGAAVRGDGRLQGQAHDTLRLSYLQPDGSTLARSVPLP